LAAVLLIDETFGGVVHGRSSTTLWQRYSAA